MENPKMKRHGDEMHKQMDSIPTKFMSYKKIENSNDFLKWAALLIKHFQRVQDQSFIIF